MDCRIRYGTITRTQELRSCGFSAQPPRNDRRNTSISKITTRLLAVSALTLSASFLVLPQAMAGSDAPAHILMARAAPTQRTPLDAPGERTGNAGNQPATQVYDPCARTNPVVAGNIVCPAEKARDDQAKMPDTGKAAAETPSDRSNRK